ncbi:MAG: tRNA (adenosine(37)-N6)-dimethylallyltransferase MiaA [Candidatus Nephthysia bennettiae]|uniref:tRNA dimethylallyltransferase n=1 Tax=Candidatus Nephthysia bennettiae TaxID=3127016 RepID=A0A934K7Q8_9BACT|nr:tRNA (adenosine(37)-N6)-dimethylallyltransferase MiaA [Candidatus Dormibacteraeota bacterium]MBJ7611244.1 tRNA (adenosine(37)-N6)-dimethylallyltransferase MiaA [Candidatus Dormibacteraeota bacterium]PZR89819.1 MAG: tRNA (adenosine(37)-N6)-dimethylallyltransferase MiaA [Candidatus Dormibacteraeota bacterium]
MPPVLAERLAAMRVPVILGPTGVGKSRAAFEVARALDAEIVVCDSRQVYDRLDIATNKPSAAELREVRYHLVGFADPAGLFTVFDFVEAATAALADIAARGRIAVVEGGSMLWADALMDGFSLAGVAPRPDRRSELEGLPLAELVAMLHGLDPTARVDERNRPRVVRAIEVLEVAGPPLDRLRRRTPPPWSPIRIGLTADLSVIDRRLAERSRRQVERGVVEETRTALSSGVPPEAPVLTGIGYAQAAGALRGEIDPEQLPEVMAQANRRYARRQLRWLRRDPRITWFDAAEDPVPRILEFLRDRLS